jgi:hypothetical protein
MNTLDHKIGGKEKGQFNLVKVGVVIQGPLVTFGQGPNNSIEGFETLEDIQSNIAHIEELGFSYVIATWVPMTRREENVLRLLENANLKVLCLETPTIFDPDHRYKQHWGVLSGAKELLSEESRITHLCKIRTDMLMPQAFWKWVVEICNVWDDKLYVSELMDRPFYQGDFIYVAQQKRLLGFLEKIVTYENNVIHPSIHCIRYGYKTPRAHYGSEWKIQRVGAAPELLAVCFQHGRT